MISIPGLTRGISRRTFLQTTAAAATAFTMPAGISLGQEKGDRPKQDPSVKVLNPQARVPLSFIIDDSTCLVNLAHFCIPQFAEVFPDQYKQDWRKLPREIPDSFVREFGEWCREHGVKGKYSIVPYPALVGWVDREMPGWTRQQLDDSLKLVRDFMTQDWDIHPEMITHTWAINTKTGKPYEERTERFQENWGFSVGKSVDELTDYLAYALRVLKNAGLPCEGVTTPGGFGSRVMPQLAQATLQSVRDVYGAEIPHYFRNLYTDDRSVAPLVQYASGLDGDDPQCVVSVVGCTGDWFGGWDGLEAGSVDQFITADLKGGRLPQVIDKGEPAILVCHWPGIYFNGERIGFNIFKEIVKRLNDRYDNLLWMKNSEIARYWAAKELTTIERQPNHVLFKAPFGSPRYTVSVAASEPSAVKTVSYGAVGSDRGQPLKEVAEPLKLVPGSWCRAKGAILACFDLPKGKSALEWSTAQ
ncbi:MAG: hypothetical protein WD872_00695 [Pirellulaceae bacterium]